MLCLRLITGHDFLDGSGLQVRYRSYRRPSLGIFRTLELPLQEISQSVFFVRDFPPSFEVPLRRLSWPSSLEALADLEFLLQGIP